MTKEALKLALEALEADPAEMVEDENGHMVFRRIQAIITLREALANEALNKMAENARELGLDYESEQTEHGWTPERIAGMARLKEAQDKKLAQLEPVAWEQFYPEMGKPKLAYLPPTESPENACYIPPQRTWVGLTDKEIEAIWKIAMFTDYGIGAELSNQPFVHYAKAIEAKLRSKNHEI